MTVRIVAAAALYFLIVFAVGFACGPVRVIWLEPRLGEIVAVLCEAPVLLGAMVLAARRLPGAVRLRRSVATLAGIGVGALVLQQLADFAVGILLRGMTPAQLVAHFATPAGMIYAALLIAFATMPVLANSPRTRRAEKRLPG